MYYINKIVSWCLSPLGVLFLGLGVSWVSSRKGLKRTSRGLAIGVLALLWVLGCGITTRFVGVPLERMSGSGCVLDYGKIPNGDAIVLLGGGMGAHEKCGASEMFGAADRAWVAAKLYKAGKAPRVTLSGDGVEVSTVPLLVDLGVPKSACAFFPDARNTEEESKLIKASLPGRCKILLVTSAFHMPRAKMLFERRGFDVVSCPADFEMSFAAEQPVGVGDFFPGAEGLQRNSYAVKEWVALLGYKVLKR